MTGDSHVDRYERRFRDEGHRGAPPRGARQLTAILPNGRTVWLRVAAPLAPAASVSQLAQTAETLTRWRHEHTVTQREAIDRLAKTVVSDAERLEQARLVRSRARRRRIVAADNKLDERLSKARDEFRSRLDRQLKIDRESLRRLRRRDLWDKILLATSFPLFAAYGEKGNPFGSNNLTLTLSLLVWLAGDHVVEALFGSGGASKSPYAVPDADAWSYLAPIGNLLAGWWLLGDRQHERFVTGVTTVKLEKRKARAPTFFYPYRTTVDLSERIGKDSFTDFQNFTEVPAVATIGSLRLSVEGKKLQARIDGLAARVRDGVLRASFRVVLPQALAALPDLGEIDIAWMVDTDKPSTAESRS